MASQKGSLMGSVEKNIGGLSQSQKKVERPVTNTTSKGGDKMQETLANLKFAQSLEKLEAGIASINTQIKEQETAKA